MKKEEAVYQYKKSTDGKLQYCLCYLEIRENRKLSTVAANGSRRVVGLPVVDFNDFLADLRMDIHEIVSKVQEGKMHSRAISLAMELLL